jgi:hypothetical protein
MLYCVCLSFRRLRFGSDAQKAMHTHPTCVSALPSANPLFLWRHPYVYSVNSRTDSRSGDSIERVSDRPCTTCSSGTFNAGVPSGEASAQEAYIEQTSLGWNISFFEDSGRFPGSKLRNMNSHIAPFTGASPIMANVGLVEHRRGLFDVAWDCEMPMSIKRTLRHSV